MIIHPELGTFDYVVPGSNLSNLSMENAKLQSNNTLLYVTLTIIAVGVVIYVLNENQKRVKYETKKT
jgi:hypothetical protein